jgi:hypothetical protein
MQVDWPEYCRVHSSRANLLIHLFAVPLFIVAVFSLVNTVFRGEYLSAAIVTGFAVLSIATQGRGHKMEPNSPRRFSGPANFLRRWFTEQFYIFPLFVLSGRWWRQYVMAGETSEG